MPTKQTRHKELRAYSPWAKHWVLDRQILFLNHGSFGACPKVVLQEQQRIRQHLEREPVRFFVRELPGLMDAARSKLATFVGASPNDLVFVPNVTYAANSVLRSLNLKPLDELLTTNHEYNACLNILRFNAEQAAAKLVVADVPFPISSPDVVVEKILGAITKRTRLLFVDQVTSPTGLVFPVERLVAECNNRGIDTFIDGAHGPGMLPLNLQKLQAAYYAGNCHKWLCAPKGAGFLVVRPDKQAKVRPLAISHGANSNRTDRSRFLIEFDYTGTADPTAYLCVPTAIEFIGSLVGGGWDGLRQLNHLLTIRARECLCQTLGVSPPCPDGMLGSLAAVPLPDGAQCQPSTPLYGDPLQDELLEKYGIEVPIVPWPYPPKRVIRISAQLYNQLGQFQCLADALRELLGA